MIKAKKKVTVLTLLVGLLVLTLLATSMLIMPDATAKAEEWSGSAIESEYGLGTEFTVPDYSVTASGTTVQASSSLIFPSGNATDQKTVILNETGQYSLVYTAVVNGKAYSKKHAFSVNDKLVSYNSSDTRVTYGKWEHSATKQGLMVRLAAGDTLTFSSPIDVSDATYKDNIVDVLVTPDSIGTFDFGRMIFTLTDSLDPSIYLKITARGGTAYRYRTYLLAGGNGQPLKGYEDDTRVVHSGNEFGAKVIHSFSGEARGSAPLGESSVNISFDAASNTAYAQQKMIIDLDNPEYFSQLWNGFPSGYVTLSIQCDMYNGSTANFCVSEVRGIEISESTVTESFVDEEAPEIKVNTEYDTMPVAKVGIDYPVPTATAIDYVDRGECEVKTHVYYNYTSPTGAVLIPYQNGCFKPDRAGNYAIVYEATDRSGNVAREVVWVRAEKEVALPVVSFDTTGVKTSGVLGEWIDVPGATATATSGKATVAITATSADGATVYDATSGGFRALVEGTYTVKATATDYIGQQKDSVSYTVTVSRGNKPLFVGEDPLPKYFISGYEYTLGEYYANDYTSGSLVKRLASAEITDKNGTHTVNAGETFRPTVSNNGEQVKVVYKCGDASLEKLVPTVVAFENDKLKLENYFVKQGVTTSASSSKITVSADTANAGWGFANSLIAKDFSATIAGINAASNYTGLRVVLEDSLDGSCAIEARLVNRGDYSEFIVGNQTIRVSKSIASGSNIQIGFDGKNFTIDKTSVTVEKTVSGESFNGFASNKLYFSIYFENATPGSASYAISDVCGHPMTNSGRDRIVPVLAILEDYGGVNEIGDVRTLPAAVVADVLTPDVTASVTVTRADGEIVKDVNGVTLDSVDPSKEYTIQLNEYGRYSVEYSMADTNEKVTQRFSYVIVVEDTEAPVITLKSTVSGTAKLNDTLVAPSFTVTDNVTNTEDLTAMRFVKTPTGEIVMLTGGSNSIVATKVGKYEFIIMMMDEAGNMATESVVINVEA